MPNLQQSIVRASHLDDRSQKLHHTKDRLFLCHEYSTQISIGDSYFFRMSIESICKGELRKPAVERTNFCWMVQMTKVYLQLDCDQLSDVLLFGVEYRGEKIGRGIILNRS